MADRIQLRRDTKARWEQYNPVLLEGEMGLVTDNLNECKIGDGEHSWNDLPLVALGYPFERSVDLGNFTTDAELDDAVKAEALFASPGATGGLPENKVIFASCSAGDQRNYTYFSLATGSQIRVVRFDPATGHLQICSRPKSSGIWSAWAELYDTDVPIASDTVDGLLTATNWKRWMDTEVTNFNAAWDDAALGSKIISAGWLSLDKPSVHSYERRDEDNA